MSFKLQDFSFRESRYERPLDDWICGRAADGSPCELGPTPRGRCSLSAGESACRPRRTVRARRALVTRWAFLTTALALALAAAGPWRLWLASPGELSVHHAREARIAARGEAGCADCHLAASSAAAFTRGVLSDAHRSEESLLCLDCHELGAHAMSPHGLEPSRLEANRDDRAAVDELVCTTCHYEHRGPGAEPGMTNLDDARCQACHRVQFPSFGTGHPELEGYPRGFVSVRFDHQTHRFQNFSMDRNGVEDRAFRCTDCHRPDRARQSMTLASYDDACASCHDGQILASSDFDFLTVMGLDTLSLEELDVAIGVWPSEEEPAPSFVTELLLRGSPEGAPYLDVLNDLDLLDLGIADEDELEAVSRYARDVKELLADLREGGREAIAALLERALGAPLSETELARLLSGLPSETVASAAANWFPGLDDELARGANEGAPPTELVYPEPVELSQAPGPGDWHRDDYEIRLLYRPTGHADPLLRAWIELAAREDRLANLYETLTDDFAAGRCAKCHDLDPEAIRWTETAEAPLQRGTTRFSHAPHISLFPAETSCEACHSLATDDDGEDGRGSGRGSVDFSAIEKAQCSACHRPRAAPDSCLTCHNYHAGF